MHGQILLSAFTETNSILVDLTIAIHLPKKTLTPSVNGSNNYQEKGLDRCKFKENDSQASDNSATLTHSRNSSVDLN